MVGVLLWNGHVPTARLTQHSEHDGLQGGRRLRVYGRPALGCSTNDDHSVYRERDPWRNVTTATTTVSGQRQPEFRRTARRGMSVIHTAFPVRSVLSACGLALGIGGFGCH